MNNPYKNLAVFAYVAVAGLVIQGLLHLSSIFTGLAQILVPDLSFEGIEGDAISVWFMIQAFIFFLWFAAYILTAVFFLVWLYRAHSNLTWLKPSYLKFTPGWAVGYWFIPFVNLYRPFQVVREIWWESDLAMPGEQMFLTESLHRAPSYLGLWWGFWIGFNVLSNLTYRIWDPDDLSTVAMMGYFFVIEGILVIAAASLLIYGILDITARQRKRYEKIGVEKFNVPPY